jgi:hypothetical protein
MAQVAPHRGLRAKPLSHASFGSISCPAKWQLTRNDGRRRKDHLMLDIAMIAIALVFFTLSVGYAVACDRL